MYQAEIDFYDNMCICLLGPCEVEISYGGEADLHQHYSACEKNPGHLKFVPVDKFSMEHLPPRYHDTDLLDIIRVISDLTVRVSVKYVSDRRPQLFPDSTRPYPFYSKHGGKMMRVGSGWVQRAGVTNRSIHGGETCCCEECATSETPKTEFGHIIIFTASHVVFDKEEAVHTTCHLFYDRGGTPAACSGAITLSGMSSVNSYVKKDLCEMTYITHNLDLIARLEEILTSYERLHDILMHRYPSPWSDQEFLTSRAECVPDSEVALTIIVSHPHGCSKQVSVGHYTSKRNCADGSSQYTYTAATCPGSSGALVYMLGRPYWIGWSDHVHGGSCHDNKDLNYSVENNDFTPEMVSR